ncbi:MULTISPECIES: DDE-type integrase/transposase/recombinase [Mycetohabitans]
MTVTYEWVHRCCDPSGGQFAPLTKGVRGKPGSPWHLDEMFVNLRDRLYALWRAADERGTELDVLLQNRRDKSAAKRVFKSAPRSVETDSYAFR